MSHAAFTQGISLTALLASMLLTGAPSAAGAAGESPAPTVSPEPSPDVMPPPAPTGRLVIADSRAMVPERNSHILYLSDIDAEVAENVRRMTRSAGTYQDYLLYTNEYLPDRMFFPGFALTQKPNRRVEVLREQARHDVESDAAAAPAPQRPAAAPPAKP